MIGLAVARAAALAGHDVVVAEATSSIGTGISSRNSEVIHAGIYYRAGSLMTRHCTRGRRMMYDFCATRGVPYRKCGKLIVATSAAEVAKIETIHAQGRANGVEGLTMITGEVARQLEPALSCEAAIESPETGIVDSHAFMLALRGEFEDCGGMIAFNTVIERLTPTEGRWRVYFGNGAPQSLQVDAVVNCAGLGAQSLARATEEYPVTRVPPLLLAKGNYFKFTGRPVFSRLIYPAPVDGGLGVHVTLDLSGRMRFGPDVEWIERVDYQVNPAQAAFFYRRIRRYWPSLPDNTLMPDYAGIRPKLTGPGELPADFVIDGPNDHGLERLVHLFGIESPGLTAALSLAEEVVVDLDG